MESDMVKPATRRPRGPTIFARRPPNRSPCPPRPRRACALYGPALARVARPNPAAALWCPHDPPSRGRTIHVSNPQAVNSRVKPERSIHLLPTAANDPPGSPGTTPRGAGTTAPAAALVPCRVRDRAALEPHAAWLQQMLGCPASRTLTLELEVPFGELAAETLLADVPLDRRWPDTHPCPRWPARR
jgi:hypothetical protein